MGHLINTAVNDGWLEFEFDLSASRTGGLEGRDDVHRFGISDFTEHDMLAIKPRGDNGSDEELRPIRVGTGVGHRQKPWSGMLFLEVLVGKLFAVDGLASRTVAACEVTTLEHELRNDSVELATLVAVSLLAGAKGSEVFCCLRDYIVVEIEIDSTSLWRWNCTTTSRGLLSFRIEGTVCVFDFEPRFYHHVG